MPPTPSPTDERLRDTIAKRKRHVDQPPRKTWPAGTWGKR